MLSGKIIRNFLWHKEYILEYILQEYILFSVHHRTNVYFTKIIIHILQSTIFNYWSI